MEKRELLNRYNITVLGAMRDLERYSLYDISVEEISASGDFVFHMIEDKDSHKIPENDMIIILAENNVETDILLCQECRKHTINPIIVIGEDNEQYVVELLKAGADDYIKKPISMRLLKTLIFIHMRRETRRSDVENRP